MVVLRGVSKSFSGQTVLQDMELEAASGECIGVIGPNGAGKTTLLRLLVGLLTPDKGKIAIAGLAPRQAAAKLPVAYYAGERALPRSIRAGTWARLVSGMDLSQIPSVNGMSRRKLGKLSSGNRQIVGLKVTLEAGRSPVTILDEPWEHLDPDGSRWLARRINEMREAGTTMVLSSHRLHDLAGLCDLYGFLVGKRLHVRSCAELSPTGTVEAKHLYQAYDEISTVLGADS